MATNQRTLEAMTRIANQLREMGVNSEDLKILNWHIGQQGRQIGWKKINGKWVLHPVYKYGKRENQKP